MSDPDADRSANDPARIALLARIGNLITEYNRAEYWLHQFVLTLAGGTQEAWVLTADMGAVTLIASLNAYVEDFVTGEYADRLAHFSTYIDRCRVYRNFYVHGIWSVNALGDGRAMLTILKTTIRGGRLAEESETDTDAGLIYVTNHCNKLCDYASAIMVAAVTSADKDPEKSRSASWPEKPDLPLPLERNRLALRAFEPPPAPSPD